MNTKPTVSLLLYRLKLAGRETRDAQGPVQAAQAELSRADAHAREKRKAENAIREQIVKSLNAAKLPHGLPIIADGVDVIQLNWMSRNGKNEIVGFKVLDTTTIPSASEITWGGEPAPDADGCGGPSPRETVMVEAEVI